MYPDANIPVVQLSVNARNSASQNYQIGEKLNVLREEGVLIMGSGNVVHNLVLVDWQRQGGFDWADQFDQYIKTAVIEMCHGDVIHFEKNGSFAACSFRHCDHYDPLLYVLGAAGTDAQVKVFNEARVLGALSMTSYCFY